MIKDTFKKLEKLNFDELWDHFDVNYLHPEELNKIESIPVELINHHVKKDYRDTLTPETLKGYVVAEGWFDNMIEGIPGRYGISKLQYSIHFGRPIYLDGYANRNNGMKLYFVPILTYKMKMEEEWNVQFRIKIVDGRLFVDWVPVQNPIPVK